MLTFLSKFETRVHITLLVIEAIIAALFLETHNITSMPRDLREGLELAEVFFFLLLIVVTATTLIGGIWLKWRINQILQINRSGEIYIILSAVKYHPPDPEPGRTAGQPGQTFRPLRKAFLPPRENFLRPRPQFVEGFMWTTPQDGIEGARLLVPLFESLGVPPERIQIVFSADLRRIPENWGANIFLIGGHQNNECLRHFHPEGAMPFNLTKNVITDDRKKPYETEMDADKRHFVADHCLVTRDVNEFARPRRGRPFVVWSFEGVRHWGTISAIRMLGDIAHRKGRVLMRDGCADVVEKKQTVQLITRCKVDDASDQAGDSEIVKAHAVPQAPRTLLSKCRSAIICVLSGWHRSSHG